MKFNNKEFIFIARNKVQPVISAKREEREEGGGEGGEGGEGEEGEERGERGEE